MRTLLLETKSRQRKIISAFIRIKKGCTRLKVQPFKITRLDVRRSFYERAEGPVENVEDALVEDCWEEALPEAVLVESEALDAGRSLLAGFGAESFKGS